MTTDDWSDDDRARLASRIQERMDELGIDTAAEAIHRAGVAPTTWYRVAGTRTEPPATVAPATYRKVDAALEWRRGSCVAILGGGEPTPVGNDLGPAEKDPLDDPRLERIRELIRELNYEFDQVRSSRDNEESRKRHGV